MPPLVKLAGSLALAFVSIAASPTRRRRARAARSSPTRYCRPRPVRRVATLYTDEVFNDFSLHDFDYAPPAHCPGPYTKVILRAELLGHDRPPVRPHGEPVDRRREPVFRYDAGTVGGRRAGLAHRARHQRLPKPRHQPRTAARSISATSSTTPIPASCMAARRSCSIPMLRTGPTARAAPTA